MELFIVKEVNKKLRFMILQKWGVDEWWEFYRVCEMCFEEVNENSVYLN